MTLNLDAAIRLIKRLTRTDDPWTGADISEDAKTATDTDDAIAAILNAVVAGELALPATECQFGDGRGRVMDMDRRTKRLLDWLEKQRNDYADMVTDAGDASLWCKDEAEAIRDHIKTVEAMRDKLDELDFLRHEGGPQSVAAMEACLREVVLPELRHTAEDLFRCVSVRLDPGSVSPSDWRDIGPAMEAVLAVEAFVGRPDDDYGARLDPILDAASWRHHQ